MDCAAHGRLADVGDLYLLLFFFCSLEFVEQEKISRLEVGNLVHHTVTVHTGLQNSSMPASYFSRAWKNL